MAKKHCHCKKHNLKLRVVSKNMQPGYELGQRLDETTTPAFNPPLPSFFDVLIPGLEGNVIPEVEVARMYQNFTKIT